MRSDPVAARLDRGPATSGVFARFERGASGWELDALDPTAAVARTLGPGAGLLAGTRRGDERATWLVTGTDAQGVRRAAAALDPAQLENRYAVATLGGPSLPLPAGGGRMRSPIAYAPRRGPLNGVSALAATVYLGSLAVVAFLYSNPIVLAGAGLAVAVAGIAAGATRALAASARWALTLGALIVAVNAVVSQRGDTIWVRGWHLPVLGQLDVSAEALAEGGVLALRIAVVLCAFAVHSACVDPDRLLRLLRPLARHSALTATLITRMVPLAAADHSRLAEVRALRGPGAAPVGRAALVRRLVAGSLDRRSRSPRRSSCAGTPAAFRAERPAPARHATRGASRWPARRSSPLGIGARGAGAGGVRGLSADRR